MGRRAESTRRRSCTHRKLPERILHRIRPRAYAPGLTQAGFPRGVVFIRRMARRRRLAPLALAVTMAAPALLAHGQPVERLPPWNVTAARTSRPAAETAQATREFGVDTLANGLALDQALRADPAFSLFRRTDSLSAHPTAQGVSLRGIGPSGASRSLVLLDGVPLNDPFGGWVIWNQLPAAGLATVEVARGGGSALWGSSALSGTIALVSAPVARAGGAFEFTAGARATTLAQLSAGATAAGVALRIDARAFATDGYPPLAAAERGAIDVPLSSDHRALQLRAQRVLGEIETTVTLRRYGEDRVNGTAGQTNSTALTFGSVALRGRTRSDGDWRLVAYGQDQTFRGTFTSASLDRATETPANRQFDVPATAAGAALTLDWQADAARTTLGADVRHVRGETREEFLFANGAFTRRRFAGGTQTLGGAFLAHDRALAAGWRGAIALRADRWQLADGTRREINLPTGAPTRLDIFPRRTGTTGSANLGLTWTPRDAARVRFAAYRAFRVPTLNELYRPFRVGNIATEANAALRPETLHGAEIGADYRAGTVEFSVTTFVNRLEDGIGNVTVASTPTLVTRERRNLDRIDIRGGEFRGRWRPFAPLLLDFAWLASASEITRAAAQPALVGRRLAQAPRHVATAAMRWDFARAWSVHAAGRWTDRQFEDDENTLTLGAAAVLDLRLEWRFDAHNTVTLALDNATDAAVPVARAANGLTSFAAPRTWRLGWRLDW